MKESILQEFIGQTIEKVTYFETNRSDHTFFYEGFDNFDLGIKITFSNDLCFSIGWRHNDRPELKTGNYLPQKFIEEFHTIDASDRWLVFRETPISSIDLMYVCQEWKIPATCTLHFENKTSVSIVLGQELNNDYSIPTPLMYVEPSEFYVFHMKELPEIELVKIILPEEYEEIEYTYNDKEPFSNLTTPVLLMLGLFGLIIYQIIKYFFL